MGQDTLTYIVLAIVIFFAILARYHFRDQNGGKKKSIKYLTK